MVDARINPDLLSLARPIADLHCDPKNARKHGKRDLETIAASLALHGQQKPIVTMRDGKVIAGNGTLEAARGLGWDRIACVTYDDEDAAKAAAFAIVDNRSAELSEWDTDVLARMLAELPLPIQASVGWTPAELAALLPGIEEPEEPPQVQADAISRRGEAYELGPHRLMCGDATSDDDLATLLRGELFGSLVTDPPYGVSYADKNAFLNTIGRGSRIQEPITNDHATPSQMSDFWTAAFTAVRRVGAPGATYYITGPQGGDLLLLLLLALRASDFPLRHMLVWRKNRFVLGRCDYHYQHEPILYGWLGGAAHFFGGGNGESSVWEHDSPHSSNLHPTMKPLTLARQMVRNGCPHDGLVLDPFGGSGSTLIAAAIEQRRARVLEIEPTYCDVIRRRWTRWAAEAGVSPGPGALT